MDKIDVDSLPIWDAADYLTTPSSQAEYLSIVMGDGDEADIAHALRAISRARMKAGLEARMSNDSVDASAVNAEGAITLAQALSVVRALGLRLNVEPADAA